MNLGILLPTLDVYGGVRRFVCLADRLVERNHQVTIYSPNGGNCKWLECRADFAKTTEFPERKHDAVLFGDPNEREYGLIKKSDARIKIFYLCMVYEISPLEKSIDKIKSQVEKYSKMKARFDRDGIGIDQKSWLRKRTLHTKIALSDGELLKFSASSWMTDIARKSVPGIKINTLFGGIDPKIFRPVNSKKINSSVISPMEKRRHKSSGKIKAIIEKAKKISKKEISLHTYRGKNLPQEKLAEYICRHKVFVDDSFLGGWHNPVIEAMACGIPVVCYDFGAVSDFAFHGKTALMCPPENVTVMAKNILQLFSDENLRRKLSENGIEQAMKFTWEKCADDFERMTLEEQ